MPKVYITNTKSFDMSPAKKYGELVVMYDGSPHDIFMLSKHIHIIKTKLAEMDKSDYLLLSGNLILNMLAGAIVLEKFGYINLLLYDVRNMKYETRVIHTHQLKGGENG